ncbi:hypothetical protein MSBR3_0350 [Methanosarcina barkeri 3]|uniref:YqaJ viral recombinase domain-containing protein n=1 Tax=Methanosarcina barkeri 3 TaxID=1434107 RepID=A0A0E3SKC0_METBA|nr:hypothetical protein MSBR3_0350 [Methanosarcina barkeri 3]
MVTRKSNYRYYNKRRPYRASKQRILNTDKLVIALICLCFIFLILKEIIQMIVTYYYVFIPLALISLIVCYITNNRLQSFQCKGPFKDKEIMSMESTDSEKNPENCYHSEEQLSPDAYQNELNVESENVEKGNKFERYVVDKFDDKLFSIVEWTTDMCRKHNRYVESDCNPDLVIRDRTTNETFCVECKYRSRLVNGFFNWSYPDQIDRYFSYSHDRKIPFYVVLGLGGNPDSPIEVFCVPLEEAKNSQIHIDMLRKYYHDLEKDFIWKNGVLK